MKYLLLGIALFAITCGAYERKDCYVDGNQCQGALPTPHPGEPGSPGERGPAGADGRNGDNGSPGMDGDSIVATTEGISPGDFFCSAGGTRLRIATDSNRNGTWDLSDAGQQVSSICNGIAGNNGADGSNGTDGHDGVDGEDGHDGADGHNGADAPPTPFTPVTIIDPCGDAPGVYDEVFLRLANGQLLWSLSDNSNGKNTRFSVGVPGNWVTTDGSNCYFTVSPTGTIINEHY